MSDGREPRLLVVVPEDDLFERVERRLRSALVGDVVRAGEHSISPESQNSP